MTGTEWLVVAGGAAAIAWINWYFFLATRTRPALAAAAAAAGVTGDGQVQEVTVTVRGGYEPSAVRVRQGQPLRLVFDRQETSGCSEEIVIGDFNVRKFLPPHRRTVVELKPDKPGAHEFTCGMGMLRGKLIVE